MANRNDRRIRGIRTPLRTQTVLGRLSPGDGDVEMLSTSELASFLNLDTEQIQDLVGAMMTDGTTIDFTYNDASGTITAEVTDGSLTAAKFANFSASTLLGRRSGSSGTPEEITLGTGLSMSSGGVLSATGGSGGGGYFGGAMGDHGSADGQLRATKGICFRPFEDITIDDAYAVIDAGNVADDYYFQLASLSTLTLDATDTTLVTAATVDSVLGTSAVVTPGSTLPRVMRGNFSTPVSLSASTNYILVVVYDQMSGTATARVHGGSSQPFHMAAPVDAYNGLVQFNTVGLSASQAHTAIVNSYGRLWLGGTID